MSGGGSGPYMGTLQGCLMAGIGPLSPQLDGVGLLSVIRLRLKAADEVDELEEVDEVIFN